MLKNILLSLGLLIMVIPTINAATCEIHAKAVVKLFGFDIEGCKIEGKLTKGASGKYSGVFSADLTKLDSGDDERNDHMLNKYLEVKKHPEIIVRLLPVSIGDKTFKAEVSLHGETHLLEGKLDFLKEGSFKAEFDIDIVKFGIEKPGFGDIVIGQNIAIKVGL